MHLSVEIPAMDLSLVDARPQELLLLTLDGLTLEHHAGNSAGISYNQVRGNRAASRVLAGLLQAPYAAGCLLNTSSELHCHCAPMVLLKRCSYCLVHLGWLPVPSLLFAVPGMRAAVQLLVRMNLAQLDDMLHGSPFPVLLVPADKTVLEDSRADPLLFFTQVSQPSRYRGAMYTPTICGRIAALRLELSETLLWRLYSVSQGLAAASGGSSAAGSSSASNMTGSSSGTGLAGPGYKASSASRGRLAGGPSSGNLAAAGGGAAAGSGAAAGQGSSAVQQVASADLPLQVRQPGCGAGLPARLELLLLKQLH
jgi:hypothetical protein